MVVTNYGGYVKHYSKGLTNRRCLVIFGALIAASGVAGFILGLTDTFGGTKPEDLVYQLGTGQNIAYLVIGLTMLLVGETWSSEWKVVFLGIVGVFFVGMAVAGFVLSGKGDDYSLVFFSVNHPWENITHLVLGLIFLATAVYPRRFRDYSFANSVSD